MTDKELDKTKVIATNVLFHLFQLPTQNSFEAVEVIRKAISTQYQAGYTAGKEDGIKEGLERAKEIARYETADKCCGLCLNEMNMPEQVEQAIQKEIDSLSKPEEPNQ